MNAIAASILAVLIAVVIFGSRRGAMLAMVAGTLYLTQYASIDVLGFNLFAVRFLEVAGLLRVIVYRELDFSRFNELDRLFLLFYSYITIIVLLRSNQNHAYAIGVTVDAVFCYAIFRALIRDVDDFFWFLRAFAVLLAPYVALLVVEAATHHNPFTIMGAATEEWFRKGWVRCFGSFRNPSLLGTLGAAFLPLYVALFMEEGDRKWGVIGSFLSAMIVVLSSSGGPASAAAVAIAGWLLWPMRLRMRTIRRGMVALFILLASFMKSPIWFLPNRVADHLGIGGDSWHRSYLMAMAARDFGRWWLWGMPLAQTVHWFPYLLPATGTADITNQYIAYGLSAGALATILFVLLLVKCYKRLGNAMRATRADLTARPGTELLLWGLGVMLTVHVENWLAITYFDQTYVIWFMQLAAIVSISDACRESHGKRHLSQSVTKQRVIEHHPF